MNRLCLLCKEIMMIKDLDAVKNLPFCIIPVMENYNLATVLYVT